MLEDMKTRHDIEGVLFKWSRQNIAAKDLSSAACFRFLCRFLGHFNAGKIPRPVFEGAEKRSRAAAEIQQPATRLVLQQCGASSVPAIRRALPCLGNDAVVVRTVVAIHLLRTRRIVRPNQSA